MYELRVPFFAIMYESNSQYALHWNLEPPSNYELRVSLLRKEVEGTKKGMAGYKKEWVQKCFFYFIRQMA